MYGVRGGGRNKRKIASWCKIDLAVQLTWVAPAQGNAPLALERTLLERDRILRSQRPANVEACDPFCTGGHGHVGGHAERHSS
eukprot:3941583-Rhodomonas_salina.5